MSDLAILIADDEPRIRLELHYALEPQAAHLLEAGTGAAALITAGSPRRSMARSCSARAGRASPSPPPPDPAAT